MSKKIFFILLVACAVAAAVPAFSQDPYWDDFNFNRDAYGRDDARDKDKDKKEQPVKEIETFSRNLSRSVTYWQMTPEDVQALRNKGLGYGELVKVVLISIKSGKPRDEIVKRRNRGESFKKICERFGLDYDAVRADAEKILSEVEIYGKK